MKVKKTFSVLILIGILCAGIAIPAGAISGTTVNESNIHVALGVYNNYYGSATGASTIFAGCSFSFDPIHAELDSYPCKACVYAVDTFGAPVDWAISDETQLSAYTSKSNVYGYSRGEFFFSLAGIDYQ